MLVPARSLGWRRCSRNGALARLAAWDVHQAHVFGRCETATGIDLRPPRRPSHVLPARQQDTPPVLGGRRRQQLPRPTLRASTRPALAQPDLVHGPVHASRLNQIYFAIVQRKVLTPNDSADLVEVEERLLAFETPLRAVGHALEWKFNSDDFADLMKRLADKDDYRKPA
jgi:hypothetical protein